MRKIILLAMVILLITSIPVQANELDVWTVTKEEAEIYTRSMTREQALSAPYQDTTQAIIIDRWLFCEVMQYDLTMKWVNFGKITDYGSSAKDGNYTIQWDVNINEGR